MKFIKTGQLRSDAKRKWLIMVDDEDYKKLNNFHWQADKYGIVSRHIGKKKHILMYRQIMNAPLGIEIDHIDGNRLNNQKSNLRFATSSQNKMNRGPRKDNKSGYKGVSWHKERNKWTARIMINGEYKHLGLFDNILNAVNAYNKIAKTYYGEYAWLNPI
jgi:hypothetical protein